MSAAAKKAPRRRAPAYAKINARLAAVVAKRDGASGESPQMPAAPETGTANLREASPAALRALAADVERMASLAGSGAIALAAVDIREAAADKVTTDGAALRAYGVLARRARRLWASWEAAMSSGDANEAEVAAGFAGELASYASLMLRCARAASASLAGEGIEGEDQSGESPLRFPPAGSLAARLSSIATFARDAAARAVDVNAADGPAEALAVALAALADVGRANDGRPRSRQRAAYAQLAADVRATAGELLRDAADVLHVANDLTPDNLEARAGFLRMIGAGVLERARDVDISADDLAGWLARPE